MAQVSRKTERDHSPALTTALILVIGAMVGALALSAGRGEDNGANAQFSETSTSMPDPLAMYEQSTE
jgi:hypothetical protein